MSDETPMNRITPYQAAQIRNDPALLREMMGDLGQYRGTLGPGPYWAASQKEVVDWLLNRDLASFRHYDPLEKTLTRFSGGAMWPSVHDAREDGRKLNRSIIFRAANRLGLKAVSDIYKRQRRRAATIENLQSIYIDSLVSLIRERDAWDILASVSDSLVGQPSDAFNLGGRLFTPIFLQKMAYYLKLRRKIGFDNLTSFVEIGPGAGQLDEIVAKAHPGCRVFLIDIPPQLYVTEQVMRAVFGEQVAGYRDTKQNRAIINAPNKRIFVLAPWQAEALQLPEVDLFMSQVFEEMPPATVRGYLDMARRWNSKVIHASTIPLKDKFEVLSADEYRLHLPEYDLSKTALGMRDPVLEMDATLFVDSQAYSQIHLTLRHR